MLGHGYFRLLRQLAFAFLYLTILILQANVKASNVIEVGFTRAMASWQTSDESALSDIHRVEDLQSWLSEALVPNMFFETTYNQKRVFVPDESLVRYVDDRMRIGVGVRMTQTLYPNSLLETQMSHLYPYPFMDLQIFTDTYCVDTGPQNLTVLFDPTSIFGSANPCAPGLISDTGVELLNSHGKPLLYSSSGVYEIYFLPFQSLAYVQEKVAFLQTMGFFNNRTRNVRLSVLARSDVEDIMTVIEVRLDFDMGGYATAKMVSVTVTLAYQKADGSWPRKNAFRLFLELLLVLTLLFETYTEVHQIRKAYHRGRRRKRTQIRNQAYGYVPRDRRRDSVDSTIPSVRGVTRQTREVKHAEGLLEYFTDFWNILDWCYIFLTVACAAVWIVLTVAVYHADSIRREIRQHSLAELQDNQAIYSHVFDRLKIIYHIQKVYLFISGINLFICFARTLQFFNFHQQLAFLNLTIHHAIKGLLNFLFVFITLFIAFATFTHICFGHRLRDFSTMKLAMLSCYKAVVEQNTFLDALRISEGNDQFGLVLAQMFSVLYVVTVAYILINVFLAIVLDAYDNATSHRQKSAGRSFIRDLLSLLSASIRQLWIVRKLDKHYHFAQVPDSMVMEIMQAFVSDKQTITANEVTASIIKLDPKRRLSPVTVNYMTESIFNEFEAFCVLAEPMQPLPPMDPSMNYPADFNSVRPDAQNRPLQANKIVHRNVQMNESSSQGTTIGEEAGPSTGPPGGKAQVNVQPKAQEAPATIYMLAQESKSGHVTPRDGRWTQLPPAPRPVRGDDGLPSSSSAYMASGSESRHVAMTQGLTSPLLASGIGHVASRHVTPPPPMGYQSTSHSDLHLVTSTLDVTSPPLSHVAGSGSQVSPLTSHVAALGSEASSSMSRVAAASVTSSSGLAQSGSIPMTGKGRLRHRLPPLDRSSSTGPSLPTSTGTGSASGPARETRGARPGSRRDSDGEPLGGHNEVQDDEEPLVFGTNGEEAPAVLHVSHAKQRPSYLSSPSR